MRAPRNAKPYVLLLAPALPNQESELQYLINTMLKFANGFVDGLVPKMPSCAKLGFQPLLLMSNLLVL